MDVTQLAQRAAQRLLVRSALNPILWLCGITSPLFVGAAWLFRAEPYLLNLFAWIAALPVIVATFGFVGFALFKPEKLQSEEYQLRHESLQLIQQKTGRIRIDPASIQAITNPAAKALDSGEPL